MRDTLTTDHGIGDARSAGLTFFFAITICALVSVVLTAMKLRREGTLGWMWTAAGVRGRTVKVRGGAVTTSGSETLPERAHSSLARRLSW